MSRIEYIEKITELLEQCDSLHILDVILRILIKSNGGI